MTFSQKLSGHIAYGLCCAIIASLILSAHPALAGNGDALRDAEADRLYQQLLAYPSDQEKTLAYARRAADLGDYEAAIAPLERLLITNPASARLRLEIGILYYMLGSKDVAKNYLQEAKNSASATEQITTQANDYLGRM